MSATKPKTPKVEARSRFAATTKGIRLRPDQVEWCNKMQLDDPEQSWSRLVREALDCLRAKYEGRIQILPPQA
jgi:hypothetical protein